MKRAVIFIFILSILAASSACRTATTENGSNFSAETRSTEIKHLSVEQAKQDFDARADAQFIDVRTPEEYAAGHAPQTANFPLDRLDEDLSKLDKEKPVYVICQTGRRSLIGAETLQKAGFKDIYNVKGGTSAWVAAGNEVKTETTQK